MKLLGATTLHTRYGHWNHPATGAPYVKPVRDNFRNFPGLVARVAAAYQRALRDRHTIADQQLFQWMAQAEFGAMDIYEDKVSIMAVERDEIILSSEEFLAIQDDALLYSLFAPVMIVD